MFMVHLEYINDGNHWVFEVAKNFNLCESNRLIAIFAASSQIANTSKWFVGYLHSFTVGLILKYL